MNDTMMIRNPETNEWESVYLPPTGDTLPVGSEVEFDGNIVPTGWERVPEKNIITDGEPVKLDYQVDGKDVYVKKINVGTGPGKGSSKTIDLTNYGFTNTNYNLVHYDLIDNQNSSYPIATGDNYSTYVWFNDATHIRIKNMAEADHSSATFYLIIYFTYKEV